MFGSVILAVVTAGGLRVETKTPDALCPDVRQVREAVRARLGEIEGQGQWLASYTLVHRPEGPAPGDVGDVVRVELRDPAGKLRMQRELPRAGESCTAVAQAMVLLLDAYFRYPTEAGDPADGGGATAGAADGAGGPAGVATARPAPPGSGAGDGASAGGGSHLGPAIDVRGGWASGPASPALAVDLSLAVGPRWAVGAEGTWLIDAQEVALGTADSPASATMRSAHLRAYLAWRLRLSPRLAVLVGPEALVVVDHVSATGFDGGGSNFRTAGGPGARAQLRVKLAPWAALSLVASADYTPTSWVGSFELDNSTGGDLFPPSAVRLFVGAGLGVGFFP